MLAPGGGPPATGVVTNNPGIVGATTAVTGASCFSSQACAPPLRNADYAQVVHHPIVNVVEWGSGWLTDTSGAASAVAALFSSMSFPASTMF